MATLALLLLAAATTIRAATITYDDRAIVINGQRKLLISGAVHYPRASPEMWAGLIDKAKAGGIDTIETYVFWNGHEPSQGSYNFRGRYNLTRFLRTVREAGLHVILRLGPYVCAEWNFGGFPPWLLNIPGIQFRTDNEPFKEVMEGFVRKIVDLLKNESMFAPQGGPIIFTQIENEYGNVEAAYGASGKRYMLWAAKMAKELNVGVPWIMCKQTDAPAIVIDTCNGYYCDGWKPNSAQKPKMWTENWSGWYQAWGEAVPHRPVEDVAFAVARFFQRGGIVQNYYMYFGGTNFGRTSGGPFITTSYDYDSPIDEYGQIRQPKWGHFKELHAALKLCEAALTSSEPQYFTLGRQQEAHVYTNGQFPKNVSGPCAAFLANIESSSSASVKFNGETYNLPPWSVSILPDCRNVVFNTAKVTVQTSIMSMKALKKESRIRTLVQSPELSGPSHLAFAWAWYREPVGISEASIMRSKGPAEQIKSTNDTTDYLWYRTRLQVTEADLAGARPVLVIRSMRDMVQVFVNGHFAGRASTVSASTLYASVRLPVKLQEGVNVLDILSATVGLQNYGAFFDSWGAGINGSVSLQGLATGTKDLTSQLWLHQTGMKGEKLQLYTGQNDPAWSSSPPPEHEQLTWYKTMFDLPDSKGSIALDLGSMGKGQAWVNGRSLGRFWPTVLAPSAACTKCDYRGTYVSSKCATGCGKPSQRWYHVPRDWLRPEGNNTLVLFEEMGGNLSGVSLMSRTLERICAVVSEYDLAPVGSKSNFPVLSLSCAAGQVISPIMFSSFGNPRGTCGEFQRGDCHAVLSTPIVEKECVGKQACSITVHFKRFGDDPCPGKWKNLAVEALCSDSSLRLG